MMAADPSALHVALADGGLQLAPMHEGHRAGLRLACAADPAIWEIYPVDYGPENFDEAFDALLANPERLAFAAVLDGTVVGMTAYLRLEPNQQTLEIGNSYIVPAQRGGGLNRRMKQLMIDHAFACGFRRIGFRIDVRNERSQAAVRKLGARQEGVMRAERITWTGHVRDTMLFGLLAEDWRAAR